MTPDADPALLERVITEQAIATEPAAPWGSYAADLRDGVAAVLSRLLGGTSGASEIADVASILLIVALPVTVLVLYRHRLLAGLRRLWPAPSGPTALSSAPPPPPASMDDARRHLAAGRARDALAAAWEATGQRLARDGLTRWRADLTHGELARSVREHAPQWPHHDRLDALARTVDTLAYGPGQPTGDAVEAALTEAEALT